MSLAMTILRNMARRQLPHIACTHCVFRSWMLRWLMWVGATYINPKVLNNIIAPQ